jgi:DNA-binding response OmpR family regulator
MPSILIVEDDDNIAELLRFMFERERYAVTTLADGQAALDHLRTSPPADVVLLDSMLPYVDGPGVLAALRRDARWAKVPVVMLTARSLERDIVGALDAGASDYVMKPFQPPELLARVRRQLRRAA